MGHRLDVVVILCEGSHGWRVVARAAGVLKRRPGRPFEAVVKRLGPLIRPEAKCMRFPLLFAFAGALTACGSPAAPGGTESGLVLNGSIRLRWFLDLPLGGGPFPAVVIGAGSGSVSADNSHTLRFARGLNDLGFAVMRYDKRGTGGSDGEVVSVSTANSLSTIPLLASDMLAVLDQLFTDSRTLEVIAYEGGEHLLPGISFWPDVTVWLDRKLQ